MRQKTGLLGSQNKKYHALVGQYKLWNQPPEKPSRDLSRITCIL